MAKETANLGDLLGGLMRQVQESQGDQVTPGWWNSLQYPSIIDFDAGHLMNFAKSALFSQCLVSRNSTVLEFNDSMNRLPGRFSLNMDNINEIAETLEAVLTYNLNDEVLFYTFDTGSFCVDISNNGLCLVSCVTTNEQKMTVFKNQYESFKKDSS